MGTCSAFRCIARRGRGAAAPIGVLAPAGVAATDPGWRIGVLARIGGGGETDRAGVSSGGAEEARGRRHYPANPASRPASAAILTEVLNLYRF